MKLIDILQGVKTVGISGHIRPDGDCIGSCLAIYNYIDKCFPDIHLDLYLEKLDEKFSFIKNADKIHYEADREIIYDLFFAMDCADAERLGDNKICFDNAKKTFCIDHHISNKGFADENYIISDASSASEVLYDLLDSEKIDKDIAEPLYLGIAHDSGMFRYPSTSKKTMDIAGEMISKGIDFSNIIDKTFYAKTYNQNRITGRILMESVLFMDNRCIVGRATKEMMDFYGVTKNDLGAVIDSLRNTHGVECAIFMYQIEEMEYKVSMRSKNIVDVSKIAMKFNGGGHVRAAGFNMSGTVYDIINNISPEIEEQLADFAEK